MSWRCVDFGSNKDKVWSSVSTPHIKITWLVSIIHSSFGVSIEDEEFDGIDEVDPPRKK